MTEQHAFADWLSRQLRRQGLNQAEFAKRLGITRAAVSAWVSGRATPRMEYMERIEEALGLAPGSVMAREDAEDRAEDIAWFHRPAHADGGRELGNAAAFAFDADLAVLAREATQNSLDERLVPTRPVRVRYTLHEISGERLHRFLDAIRWNDLEPHFVAAADERQKVGRVLAGGLAHLRDTGSLLLLRVDDYNATGLTGDEYADGRFAAVVRRQLDSQKSGTAGGSYGLGKATLWAASRLGMVLINSTLSEPYGGRHERRLIGRLDLPWRRVGDTEWAGPAWFGAKDTERASAARSWWADEKTVEDLFLTRESNAPGTSFLVVGAHDAGGGANTLEEMHESLVNSLADNFWGAMTAAKTETPLLEASVVALRDGAVVVAEERVDPRRRQAARTRALQAFLDGTTVSELTSADSVVRAGVKLRIPPLKTDPGGEVTEHEAVLLLTPAEEDKNPNRLVCMRSSRMVVMERVVSDLPLGTPKFQAVLLAGHAAGPDSGDAEGAERFLRTAEPPEHNDWKRTDDLTTTYARGAISRINEFRQEMINVIRRLLRNQADSTTQGPSILNDLLRLDGPTASATRNPGFPTVKHVQGELGADGAWHVRVEVRLPERDDPWLLSPVLRFVTRSGPKPAATWSMLRGESNCEVSSGNRLLFAAGQRTAVFHGISDVTSHPVSAQMAAVEIELERGKADT